MLAGSMSCQHPCWPGESQFQQDLHRLCVWGTGRVAEAGAVKKRYTGMCAQVLMTQLAAKAAGYADVVYLDAKTDTLLEEVSSCNIFAVFGNVIKTPPLQARDLTPLPCD